MRSHGVATREPVRTRRSARSRSFCAATTARADGLTRFGQRGQIVLTDAIRVSGAITTYSKLDAVSRSSILFEPGFDYFVVDHLALGASVQIGGYDDKLFDGSGNLVETKSLSIDGGVRASVEIPLGERLSLLPRLRLSYGTETYTVGGVAAPASNFGQPPALALSQKWSENYLGLYLYVPLLFHLAPHFFVGIGPSVYTDIARGSSDNPSENGNRRTSWGFTSVIGGWF